MDRYLMGFVEGNPKRTSSSNRPPTVARSVGLTMLCLIAMMLLGCTTPPGLSSIDLNDPGWTVQHGQAVWKPNRDTPDIAGDLLVATRTDGSATVQFMKTPFTIVIGQITAQGWQIEFPAENKTYSGRGTPPKRLSWLHLAAAINGKAPSEPWLFGRQNGSWRLHNTRSGEAIEGFTNP